MRGNQTSHTRTWQPNQTKRHLRQQGCSKLYTHAQNFPATTTDISKCMHHISHCSVPSDGPPYQNHSRLFSDGQSHKWTSSFSIGYFTWSQGKWSCTSLNEGNNCKIQKLANDPMVRNVWTKAMCKELGQIAQGYAGPEGTNTVIFMTIDEIKRIPKDRTVTYVQ